MDQELKRRKRKKIYRGDWLSEFRFLISPECPLTNTAYVGINLPYGVFKTVNGISRIFIGNTRENFKKHLDKDKNLFKSIGLDREVCNTLTQYAKDTHLKVWGQALQIGVFLNETDKRAFLKQRIPPFLELKKDLISLNQGFLSDSSKDTILYPLGTIKEKELGSKIQGILKEVHRITIMYGSTKVRKRIFFKTLV